ncbi:MAG: RHS repeat-associated core domain-containing protein, partial [Planctomycetes bacterium]|nr:RHS repeat-associated core domain-containing protein [Planctomycetota bacterium]
SRPELAFNLLAEPDTGLSTLACRDVQRGGFAIRRARTQGETRPGLFGAGWRSDLDARVFPVEGGFLVRRTLGDRRFVPTQRKDAFLSETGAVELLIETEEGFQLRDLMGRTFRFDSEGRLSGLIPEFLLERSETRLTLRSLADASVCTLELDAQGRVASGEFTAPGQPLRSLRYHYEGAELVRVDREVLGLIGGKTVYQVEDGRVTSIQENDTPPLHLAFDGEGRLTRLSLAEWAQTYRYKGNTTAVTSAEGTYLVAHSAQAWKIQTPAGTRTLPLDDRGRFVFPGRTPSDAIAPAREVRVVATAAPAEEETPASVITESEGETVVEVAGARLVERHDEAGRLVSRTTPDGRQTRFAYDEGKVVQSDANGETTFRYEGTRLTQVKTPAGRSWTFNYGPLDAPNSDLLRSSDGPSGPVTFGYDTFGRMVSRADATGAKIAFLHDEAGVRAAKGSDGSGYSLEKRNGALVARQGSGGRETLQAKGKTLTIQSPDATIRYTFAQESAYSLETPWGRFANQQHEGRRRLDSPAGRFQFDFDSEGRRTTLTYPNGLVLRWSYDALGRVTRHRLEREGETVLELGSRWDKRNERRAEVRDGVESRFAYDHAGRLAEVVTPEGRIRYGYDNDGNRTSESRSGRRGRRSRAGLYDARGRLVRWGEQTQHYDAAGRLTQRGQTRYRYNALGQLTGVDRKGQAKIRYAYDATGRRVERRVGDAKTRFVWDDTRLLAELGPGGRTRVYVYGAGRDLPLAYREGERWTYLVANERHDVVAYLDEEGRRVDDARFLPFGELLEAPDADRPVFFAGRLVDRATGLVNMRARDYCPELGRFLTPDPSGLAGGINAYVYVGNRPLECVDPSGLSEEPGMWGAIWTALKGSARNRVDDLARDYQRVEDVAEIVKEQTVAATSRAWKSVKTVAKDVGEGALHVAGLHSDSDPVTTYFARKAVYDELAKTFRPAWRGFKRDLRAGGDAVEGALLMVGLHPDSDEATTLAAQGAFLDDLFGRNGFDRSLGLAELGLRGLQTMTPLGFVLPEVDLSRQAYDASEMRRGQETFLKSANYAMFLLPIGGTGLRALKGLGSFGRLVGAKIGRDGLRQGVRFGGKLARRQTVGAGKAATTQGFFELGDRAIHPLFSLASGLTIAGLRRAAPRLMGNLARAFTSSRARSATRSLPTSVAPPMPRAPRVSAPAAPSQAKGLSQKGISEALKQAEKNAKASDERSKKKTGA